MFAYFCVKKVTFCARTLNVVQRTGTNFSSQAFFLKQKNTPRRKNNCKFFRPPAWKTAENQKNQIR
jgi:hypothetical protein